MDLVSGILSRPYSTLQENPHSQKGIKPGIHFRAKIFQDRILTHNHTSIQSIPIQSNPPQPLGKKHELPNEHFINCSQTCEKFVFFGLNVRNIRGGVLVYDGQEDRLGRVVRVGEGVVTAIQVLEEVEDADGCGRCLRLALGVEDGRVILMDVNKNQVFNDNGREVVGVETLAFNFDPEDSNPREERSPVSCLYYLKACRILAIGFESGGWELWDVDEHRLMFRHEGDTEGHLSISGFSLSLPIDDPKNFIYLWVVYGNRNTFECCDGLRAEIWGLEFRRKYEDENQVVYKGLTTTALKLSIPLSSQNPSRLITIKPLDPIGTLTLISFETSHNSYHVSLFDLNQWYSCRMLESLYIDENTGLCPYFLSIEVEAQAGSDSVVMDVEVYDVEKYENEFLNVEIYDWIWSKSWRVCTVTQSSTTYTQFFGVQERILRLIGDGGGGRSMIDKDALKKYGLGTVLGLAVWKDSFQPLLHLLTSLLDHSRPSIILQIASESFESDNIDLILTWIMNYAVGLRKLADNGYWGQIYAGSNDGESVSFMRFSRFAWTSLLGLVKTLGRVEEVWGARETFFADLTKGLERLVAFSTALEGAWKSGLFNTQSNINQRIQTKWQKRRKVLTQAMKTCPYVQEEDLKTVTATIDSLLLNAFSNDFIRQHWKIGDEEEGIYPPKHAGYVLNMLLWEVDNHRDVGVVVAYYLMDVVQAMENDWQKDTILECFFTTLTKLSNFETTLVTNFHLIDEGNVKEALPFLSRPGVLSSDLSFTTAVLLTLALGEVDEVTDIFCRECVSEDLLRLFITLMCSSSSAYNTITSTPTFKTYSRQRDFVYKLFSKSNELGLLRSFVRDQLPFVGAHVVQGLVDWIREQCWTYDGISILMMLGGIVVGDYLDEVYDEVKRKGALLLTEEERSMLELKWKVMMTGRGKDNRDWLQQGERMKQNKRKGPALVIRAARVEDKPILEKQGIGLGLGEVSANAKPIYSPLRRYTKKLEENVRLTVGPSKRASESKSRLLMSLNYSDGSLSMEEEDLEDVDVRSVLGRVPDFDHTIMTNVSLSVIGETPSPLPQPQRAKLSREEEKRKSIMKIPTPAIKKVFEERFYSHGEGEEDTAGFSSMFESVVEEESSVTKVVKFADELPSTTRLRRKSKSGSPCGTCDTEKGREPSITPPQSGLKTVRGRSATPRQKSSPNKRRRRPTTPSQPTPKTTRQRSTTPEQPSPVKTGRGRSTTPEQPSPKTRKGRSATPEQPSLTTRKGRSATPEQPSLTTRKGRSATPEQPSLTTRKGRSATPEQPSLTTRKGRSATPEQPSLTTRKGRSATPEQLSLTTRKGRSATPEQKQSSPNKKRRRSTTPSQPSPKTTRRRSRTPAQPSPVKIGLGRSTTPEPPIPLKKGRGRSTTTEQPSSKTRSTTPEQPSSKIRSTNPEQPSSKTRKGRSATPEQPTPKTRSTTPERPSSKTRKGRSTTTEQPTPKTRSTTPEQPSSKTRKGRYSTTEQPTPKTRKGRSTTPEQPTPKTRKGRSTTPQHPSPTNMEDSTPSILYVVGDSFMEEDEGGESSQSLSQASTRRLTTPEQSSPETRKGRSATPEQKQSSPNKKRRRSTTPRQPSPRTTRQRSPTPEQASSMIMGLGRSTTPEQPSPKTRKGRSTTPEQLSSKTRKRRSATREQKQSSPNKRRRRSTTPRQPSPKTTGQRSTTPEHSSPKTRQGRSTTSEQSGPKTTRVQSATPQQPSPKTETEPSTTPQPGPKTGRTRSTTPQETETVEKRIYATRSRSRAEKDTPKKTTRKDKDTSCDVPPPFGYAPSLSTVLEEGSTCMSTNNDTTLTLSFIEEDSSRRRKKARSEEPLDTTRTSRVTRSSRKKTNSSRAGSVL